MKARGLAAGRSGGKVGNNQGSVQLPKTPSSGGGKMSVTLVAVLLLQAIQAVAIQAASPQRPPPSTTDMPGWSKAPGPQDMVKAYPQEAARVNLAGSATLECTVGADGGLTDCVASDETPAGSGFGAASVAVSSKFQMPTKAPSGASTVGRTVRFPIQWINPASGKPTEVVVFDDAGRLGSVGFNCRVRDDKSLDNCVVVDARPRGTTALPIAGEAIQRQKAAAQARAGSRVMVIVEVKRQQ
jgi:TonB family protein